jgi:NAD(P)-dependent dehydrogenase (short-subunit alcohol dehydrogenase family)
VDGRSLDGKIALVTGAARGVGKGIARELARAGCGVVLNDVVSDGSLEKTAAEVAQLGVETLAVRADVGVSADVAFMFAKVIDHFHRLDILVNNAGIQTWKALLQVTEAEWDAVIRTNLKGCFLCTQAAAAHMRAKGGGAIVNIGSGSNKVAFPQLVAYTASKGGIETLTKVAALELGRYGIRVNCVAPGAIDVERTRRDDPDYPQTWGRMAPLHRVGTPEDVGRAVVFLVSADAGFVTGQTLWVDGGVFSRAPWPGD